jgi:hypothetical protein
MPFDYGLFEHVELGYHNIFFQDGGELRDDMTIEEFIMQCKYAKLSLRWV